MPNLYVAEKVGHEIRYCRKSNAELTLKTNKNKQTNKQKNKQEKQNKKQNKTKKKKNEKKKNWPIEFETANVI